MADETPVGAHPASEANAGGAHKPGGEPVAGNAGHVSQGRKSTGKPRVETAQPALELETCPSCLKPLPLCICEEIAPVDNGITLLVLQHPQEQDRWLGTARLATRQLANSVFRIGLSWPSLSKALGYDADPSRWAVLHLGSTTPAELPTDSEVVIFDKKGTVMTEQPRALSELEGIVIFDGTWSQAKTLWWRNAWVLKAKRIVLNPRQASLYGKLRREPRRESLSTIEAAALALGRAERRPDIASALRKSFELMLARYAKARAEGLIPLEDGPRKPRADNRFRRKGGAKRRPAARPKSPV